MEQAINAYYTVTASEKFREIKRLRAKARHDEAQALHHAKQAGMQEGRQEGEETKALSIAQLMIDDGESDDKIMRYTGLSLDDLKKLKS